MFTADGKFRQQLSRVWDATKPILPFVLLNPSTAGRPDPVRDNIRAALRSTDPLPATQTDDPTSRKGIGFAQRLGYGGMVFANLFDYCATDPKDLKAAGYPLSADADRWIHAACASGDGKVICGWGANTRSQRASDRAVEVLALMRYKGFKPMALRLLRDGIPEHPLMLPYSCVPFEI